MVPDLVIPVIVNIAASICRGKATQWGSGNDIVELMLMTNQGRVNFAFGDRWLMYTLQDIQIIQNLVICYKLGTLPSLGNSDIVSIRVSLLLFFLSAPPSNRMASNIARSSAIYNSLPFANSPSIHLLTIFKTAADILRTCSQVPLILSFQDICKFWKTCNREYSHILLTWMYWYSGEIEGP